MRFVVHCVVWLVTVLIVASENSARAQNSGTKYALLVGVKNYSNGELGKLPFTENDATAMRDVLIGHCGYDRRNVILMTQSEAAKDLSLAPEAKKIRKNLQRLIRACGKRDSLLIGLAGHGVQFVGEKENYFCPADADLTDKKSLIGLQTEIYQALEKQCQAAVKLLFVDACRNDPRTKFGRGRKTIDLRNLNRPQTLDIPQGIATFFSCKAGQQAFEDKDLKHGVFFHYLIEGLKGKARAANGSITLSTLKDYVHSQVKAHVLDQLKDVQTPDLRERTNGVVTLVKGVKDKPEVPVIGSFKKGSTWEGTFFDSDADKFHLIVHVVSRDGASVSGVCYFPYFFDGRGRRQRYEAFARFSGAVKDNQVQFTTSNSKAQYGVINEATTYKGKLKGDAFTGNWVNGKFTGRFELKAVSTKLPASKDAMPVGSLWRGKLDQGKDGFCTVVLGITHRYGSVVEGVLEFPIWYRGGRRTPYGSRAWFRGQLIGNQFQWTTYHSIKGNNGQAVVPCDYSGSIVTDVLTGSFRCKIAKGSIQLKRANK